MNDYSNKLIYGKDSLKRIVSVEVDDTHLHVFRELEDGSITKQSIEGAYWFITNKNINPNKAFTLAGHQFYKYYYEFSSRTEMRQIQSDLYKKRIDHYSIYDPKESNLTIYGMTYFKGMQPKDVSILSFDIESDGLTKTDKSEIYIISNTFRKKDQIIRKSFYLDEYDNQGLMIDAWCNWVREVNPSIMLGHNIYGYDLPYLAHVAKNNNTTLKLGRDDSDLRFNEKTSAFRKDGSQSYDYHKAYIYGREIIDSFFVSIQYDIARNFESYGLKPIIKHLGLEKADRTFIDAGKMKQIFNNRLNNPIMWNNAKLYAAEDSDDALKLFDIMIPSKFYFTQSVSKSFQEMCTSATGSQINNMMIRAYLQDGHSIAKATEIEPFEGGISMGVAGIYKNCLKWDLASAYPHTIIQYNLFDKVKDPNGYFLEMINTFTKERIKNKKLAKEIGLQYYKDMEQSGKTVINSFFGFSGAPGLNYNSPLIAAEITRKCRSYITEAVKWATNFDIEYWKNKTIKEDN